MSEDGHELSMVDGLPDQELDADAISLNSMKAIVSDELDGAKFEHPSDSISKDPILEKYHTACQQGDLKTIKEMIESKIINIEMDYDPLEKVSGLHWACINNRLSLVRYLVKSGADINMKGGDLAATPLHWASKSGLVYIVDELLKLGADPTIKDGQGYNLLHTSVFSSNIMLVLYVLFFVVDGQFDIDEKDPTLRTALHWAAYQSDTLTVEALLKFDASAKILDEAGFSPLHWATVKGYTPVMELLIEKGGDFFQTTNDGKNCFTIGNELFTIDSLKDALYKNGYDKTGFPFPRYFSGVTGKVVTFFLPWVLIPTIMLIFSNITFIVALLVNSMLLLLSGYAISKVIIRSFLLERKNAMLKSPLWAGILSGSMALSFVLWIFKILPMTITEEPLANMLMVVLYGVISVSFVFMLKNDPGCIPGNSDHDEVRKTIKELLSLGKYDGRHFCVHSWIRIPLRSKYDRDLKLLVSRFDHFCPWVYNQVALLNHKVFIIFILGLETTVWVFAHLAIEYFDELEDYIESSKKGKLVKCSLLGSEDLCFGYKYDPFTFIFMGWAAFQALWVLFLIFVQSVQIIKGVTDYELTQLNKKLRNAKSLHNEYFRSTPMELMDEQDLAELELENQEPERVTSPAPRTYYQTAIVVLGLDKALSMVRSLLKLNSNNSRINNGALAEVPTDFGWRQNVKDFWLLPDKTLPLLKRIILPPKDSHANLNGKSVDYYKLFKLPIDTDNLV